MLYTCAVGNDKFVSPWKTVKCFLHQGTSFKLEKERLVGFIFMSPDGDVSTHKTAINDPAFEV